MMDFLIEQYEEYCESKKIITFRGTPINELSDKELIGVVYFSMQEREKMQADAKHEREFLMGLVRNR